MPDFALRIRNANHPSFNPLALTVSNGYPEIAMQSSLPCALIIINTLMQESYTATTLLFQPVSFLPTWP